MDEKNNSRFKSSMVFMADSNGQPQLTVVVKATLVFDKNGRMSIAGEQTDICLQGEVRGDIQTGSYIYEPEVAPIKPSGDIVLIGHAYANKPGTTQIDCGVRVGKYGQVARVFGDRYWEPYSGGYKCTPPAAFEKIPLIYENAFGGWDRHHENPKKHKCEMRNPVGTGLGPLSPAPDERIRLANIEDRGDLTKSVGQVVKPVGFGFVSPHWNPRTSYIGTYNEQWEATRKPKLPLDFNNQFFNAAPPGLTAPQHLLGNEPITLVNVLPTPRVDMVLPGIAPPSIYVSLRNKAKPIELQPVFDTLIINSDELKIFMIWRDSLPLRNGPNDVAAVEIDFDHPAARRAVRA